MLCKDLSKRPQPIHDRKQDRRATGANLLYMSGAPLRPPIPADVFASADAVHMAQVTGEGKVTGATVFAHNRLVVVTPRDNPANLKTPFDLARSGIRLDVAAPAVPAGASAQKAIDRLAQQPGAPAGFAAAGRHTLVSAEDNVEAVVTRLSLGAAVAVTA